MKYAVVTTFHEAGYKQYGQRMLQTFLTNWPQQVDLWAYTERCLVDEFAPNLFLIDLETASPELVQFKNTWQGVPRATGDVSADPVRSKRKDAGKGFKWDAVRFAHKVYSIFHCAQTCDADVLIRMDADIVCHSPISISDIEKLCPADRDLCFLGRRNKFSECGLYAMNLKSPAVQSWLADFQRYYDNAEQGIFTLDEWHDSFVFEAVRKNHTLKELDWSSDLVQGEGHPLINSEWGAWLDHLKGKRKTTGRSLPKDLLVSRSESYWNFSTRPRF